jgi:hypothetical protein
MSYFTSRALVIALAVGALATTSAAAADEPVPPQKDPPATVPDGTPPIDLAPGCPDTPAAHDGDSAPEDATDAPEPDATEPDTTDPDATQAEAASCLSPCARPRMPNAADAPTLGSAKGPHVPGKPAPEAPTPSPDKRDPEPKPVTLPLPEPRVPAAVKHPEPNKPPLPAELGLVPLAAVALRRLR